MRHFNKIVAVYAIGAIVAFGHAFHYQQQYNVTWLGEHQERGTLDRGLIASLAAMFWPLYWSQYAWSKP